MGHTFRIAPKGNKLQYKEDNKYWDTQYWIDYNGYCVKGATQISDKSVNGIRSKKVELNKLLNNLDLKVIITD